jgi:hypothetical protein
LTSGAYLPGVYGTTTMPVPAPAGPYPTTFAAFNGEPVAGVWRLWVYDDRFSDTGTIHNVTLFVATHIVPDVTQVTPPNATSSVTPKLLCASCQPWVMSGQGFEERTGGPFGEEPAGEPEHAALRSARPSDEAGRIGDAAIHAAAHQPDECLGQPGCAGDR